MTHEPESKKLRWWVFAAVFTAIAVALAVFYVAEWPPLLVKKMDSTLACLVIAAVIPWLLPWVESVKVGGWEIKMRLEKHEDELREHQRKLTELFLRSMEPDMYDTLESLQEQPDFTYPSDEGWANAILTPQMNRLYELGYVCKRPDDFEQKTQIGEGKIVTDTGRTGEPTFSDLVSAAPPAYLL
jgi:hypothetical protein